MKKPLGAAAVIIVMVVMAVPTVASAKPAPLVCPGTGQLEVASSIRLHADLACQLSIVTPRGGSITVNLNGHSVDGVVDDGQGPIRIVHGTVKTAIQVVNNIVLKRVHVMGGVGLAFGPPIGTIEIYDSTIDGRVFDVEHGVIVDHSVIGNGIVLFDAGGTITHNDITGGVLISSIEFPDSTGLIADNTIVGDGPNGAGIDISDAVNVYALTIRHNTVTGTTGDGIRIVSSCGPPFSCFTKVNGGVPYDPITLRGNRTIGNGGHGIVIMFAALSSSHVVDGGKNVASGNATDPQCIGVVCKP